MLGQCFRDSGLSGLNPKCQKTVRETHVLKSPALPFPVLGATASLCPPLLRGNNLHPLQNKVKLAFWFVAGPRRRESSLLGDSSAQRSPKTRLLFEAHGLRLD